MDRPAAQLSDEEAARLGRLNLLRATWARYRGWDACALSLEIVRVRRMRLYAPADAVAVAAWLYVLSDLLDGTGRVEAEIQRLERQLAGEAPGRDD